MCGITFIFDLRSARDVSRPVLQRMNDSQLHRRPDEGSLHIEPGVGFGHRRLSIIDIASRQQPLFDEDGSVTIVFNAESFNDQALIPGPNNGKVIDIIKELQSYGVDAHVNNPTAYPDEGLHEYGVMLERFDDLPHADLVVPAVAHREYKGQSVEALGRKMVKGGAFIDVNAAFDQAAITVADFRFWRP